MTLGYLIHFWEDEYIVSISSSFGTINCWEDDPSHLSRLIIKACVSDMELVAQFMVLTEAEDF